MDEKGVTSRPVLHVVVVGFHHKKGCQVEFSYPPLVQGEPPESHEVPSKWKHLPSLALPDGAHNFTEDTVYFHLRSCTPGGGTVYGISCYRQINSSELVTRSTEITRNTVQKSVCVLSQLPLYGLLKAKLELITRAYFSEKDFSQVALLEQMYDSLNASLTDQMLIGTQVFLDLSVRELVLLFKHKLLVLFKLLLLERRVLFYGSPAHPVGRTLLTVCSLIPGMIEHGLSESAASRPTRPLSQTLRLASGVDAESDDYLEVHYSNSPGGGNVQTRPPRAQRSLSEPQGTITDKGDLSRHRHTSADVPCASYATNIDMITQAEHVQDRGGGGTETIFSPNVRKERSGSDPFSLHDITRMETIQTRLSHTSVDEKEEQGEFSAPSAAMEDLLEVDDCTFNWDEDKLHLSIDDNSDPSPRSEVAGNEQLTLEVSMSPRFVSSNTSVTNNKPPDESPPSTQRSPLLSSGSAAESVEDGDNLAPIHRGLRRQDSRQRTSSMSSTGSHDNVPASTENQRSVSPTTLPTDGSGLPLAIFTKGVVCQPYLCLQYHDLLLDVNVRGFCIGASNMLFRQRRHLLDVIVDVTEGQVEINDTQLNKQLTLTTADLRFADELVRNVTEDRGMYLDDTEWVGGDEWLRGQFKHYLLTLLATVSSDDMADQKLLEDFNPGFVAAWKTTHNYKQWHSNNHSEIDNILTGHPHHGQLNVADMKLRLSTNLQGSERGKKLNAAMQQTGKVVLQTSKAVGGALTSAKSAVSSWLSGLSREWVDEKHLTADVSTSNQSPPDSQTPS